MMTRLHNILRRYCRRLNSYTNLVILSCFVFTWIPTPTSSLNAGYVEPVPGTTTPTKLVTPHLGNSSTKTVKRSANLFPPSGGSRSAILTKLTSPRRNFGGHMFQDPTAPSSIHSPIGSDLYAFSKSMESHQQDTNLENPVPFVRFPTISAPYPPSGHGDTSYPRHQSSPRENEYHSPPPRHNKPLAKSVSDLLAQRGQDGGPQLHPSDDDILFDSYYTTGSDDPQSSLDVDRYSSHEDGSLFDELNRKQSATRSSSVVDDASYVPSPPPPSHSSTTKYYEQMIATKNKSNLSSSSTVGSTGSSNSSVPIPSSNSSVTPSLSKPTLLPLPQDYLSLATFKQIDNTLEKSSSNILRGLASFWNSATQISSSTSSKADTNSKEVSSSSLIALNHDSEGFEDESNRDDHDTGNVNDSRSRKKSKLHGNKGSSRGSSGVGGIDISHAGGDKSASESAVPPAHPNYISIADFDRSERTSDDAAESNQYMSLDDEEEEEEQGVKVKHENEPATVDEQKAKHKQVPSQEDHQSGVKDGEEYVTSSEASSKSGLFEDDSWLDVDAGESAQSSQSFHDNLFHTNVDTIRGIIDTSKSSEGDSSILAKKGVFSASGSSKIERVLKNESDSKRLGDVPSSTATTRQKVESDKIWGSIDSYFGRNDLIESVESEEDSDYYYGMTIGGFLKRELWTIPLFVLASLNMVLIILFEVYVLCRARGTSRRHLFLGQMLLFGLFLCSFLALMFAVHPSIVGCFIGRLGVGITYSLIFSVLMVKCVFLLSLDTGVYLPTSYQAVLLFFAVAVQVAIDTQWVIMYPPFLHTVESGRSILIQCGTSFIQLLYSLAYVGFLVVVVGFLAGRAAYKGVVENYREAVYILITAVVTVPVGLSWTVAGWMLQGRHQDACVSFGLVAHSLTTFLIMFMPKGRQLASMEKEAVCFEDQEDQCSGYSPSFFHFKPTTKNYKTTLWGGDVNNGNLYTTLEPTVSTINPNVFFHRNDFHSGMIY